LYISIGFLAYQNWKGQTVLEEQDMEDFDIWMVPFNFFGHVFKQKPVLSSF